MILYFEVVEQIFLKKNIPRIQKNYGQLLNYLSEF